MPSNEILYGIPLWAIALGLLLLLIAAAEIGFRGGRRRYSGGTEAAGDTKEDEGAEFSTIQGAILGLLGLLLAFTYSLASGHYDTRKQVVVSEANAIGTAWLRTDLMAQPHRGELQELLRSYVDLRLELASAPIAESEASTAARESERLHPAMWGVVFRSIADHAPTDVDALLVSGMNEVIDLHAKRIGALRDHVPEVVIFLLMFVATVALGIAGFAAGCRGRRNLVLTVMLSLLIVAVIDVTMDLDRPRRGLITINQQCMIDLQQSLRVPH